jgi:hypothetical protein
MMTIDWQRVLPVFFSIGVIIAIAILRQHSRTLATITATMPINIPLALWIVYSGDQNTTSLASFIEGLIIGLIPTFVFLVLAYFGARAGWSVAPTIAVGYIGWGICLGILLLAQSLLKR